MSKELGTLETCLKTHRRAGIGELMTSKIYIPLIAMCRVGGVDNIVHIRVLDVDFVRIDTNNWPCAMDICGQSMYFPGQPP